MFSKCLQPICHYLSMDSEVVTARCRRGDKGSRISTLTVQVTSGAVVPPLIHGNLFGCGASLRTTCIEGLLPMRVDPFSLYLLTWYSSCHRTPSVSQNTCTVSLRRISLSGVTPLSVVAYHWSRVAQGDGFFQCYFASVS